GEPDLMDASDNGRDADAGWMTLLDVVLEPDPRLSEVQKSIIETGFGMREGQLRIHSRGALVQYVLQRYQYDSTKIQTKAAAQQIVVANLDELQAWLYN